MGFEIGSFIECVVYKDIDCNACRKIIMYYLGDNFEIELKLCLANYYIGNTRSPSHDMDKLTNDKILKIIKILDSRDK